MTHWHKILAEKDSVIVHIAPDDAKSIREVLEEKRRDVLKKISEEGPRLLWADLRDAIDGMIEQINEQVEIDQKVIRSFAPLEERKCHCGNYAQPEHMCPARVELNSDSLTLCNCCESCRQVCCNDI